MTNYGNIHYHMAMYGHLMACLGLPLATFGPSIKYLRHMIPKKFQNPFSDQKVKPDRSGFLGSALSLYTVLLVV